MVSDDVMNDRLQARQHVYIYIYPTLKDSVRFREVLLGCSRLRIRRMAQQHCCVARYKRPRALILRDCVFVLMWNAWLLHLPPGRRGSTTDSMRNGSSTVNTCPAAAHGCSGSGLYLSTAPHGTARHSTAQHSTAQHVNVWCT